jgi:hypothetical protein
MIRGMELNPYEAPQDAGQQPEWKSSLSLVPIPKIDLPPSLLVAAMAIYAGGIAMLAWIVLRSLS